MTRYKISIEIENVAKTQVWSKQLTVTAPSDKDIRKISWKEASKFTMGKGPLHRISIHYDELSSPTIIVSVPSQIIEALSGRI